MKSIGVICLSSLMVIIGCGESGMKKQYFPNGRTESETMFKHGKPDGVSKHYSEGGRLIVEDVWTDGELDTTKYYGKDYQFKVAYNDAGRIKQVYRRESDTSKFMPVTYDRPIAYAYSEKDTLTLGEQYKVRILLLTADSEKIKRANTCLLSFDTVIMGMVMMTQQIAFTQGQIDFYSAPNIAGHVHMDGIIRVANDTGKGLSDYPFRTMFFVKKK